MPSQVSNFGISVRENIERNDDSVVGKGDRKAAWKIQPPLHQLVQQDDDDDPNDESKEAVLSSLRTVLQEVKDGKVHPIEELWDAIDD